MFGEQPPSALLRPGASLQASSTLRPSSSPPSRSAHAPSNHSAFRPGVPCPTSSCSPTPFATNIAHNINVLYGDVSSSSNDKNYKPKRKDKFVPSLSPISTVDRTNSGCSSIASSGSMIGVINDFKEQECGWKGRAHLAIPPKDGIRPIDRLSAPLHKESSYNRPQKTPLKKRHSAQFVHYRNSFKSLATIIDMVGGLLIFWDRELTSLLLTGR